MHKQKRPVAYSLETPELIAPYNYTEAKEELRRYEQALKELKEEKKNN